MIEVKTPGKLYIAGEYAVVNPGNKAIIMSVDKFIKIKLKKSSHEGSIKSYTNLKVIYSRYKDQIVIDQKDDRFEYIISAMNVCESYLIEKGFKLDFYDIEVLSDLESEDGIKYGLGSSAAVVVSVIKAILEYYKVEYTNMEIFKLSCLSSILLNKNGSCGDIASAVFTGLIKYTSFDREEILKRVKEENIIDLIKSNWNSLDIKKIDINKDIKFLIGWTKSPASSYNLVNKSKSNVKNNPDFYNKFLKLSDECVEEFENGYINNDYDLIKDSIEKNRDLLREYSKNYGIEIEKKSLEKLIEISNDFNAASKTSGAGGGDCGIAIVNKSFNYNELIDKWQNNNIIKLDLNIYEDKDESRYK